MSAPAKHLFVSLSPHGYGHAAMTMPVLNALRRRAPDLRLTLQTAAPRSWLEVRLSGPFEIVADTPDFGARMNGPLEVDIERTAADYRALHEDFERVAAAEAERLQRLAVDAVLSNVSYVALAAAERAGIPAAGYSCLNWHDVYAHYCGGRPEAAGLLQRMLAAYDSAAVFLRPEPGMPMSALSNLRPVGPVASRTNSRRKAVEHRLGIAAGTRLALIGFGGIELPLPFAEWVRLPGWHWLVPEPVNGRADMTFWQEASAPFSELLASVDVVVTKPGYGTFTECAIDGVPVLYLPRPDWPESHGLIDWLRANGRCLEIALEDLFSARLADQLQSLLAMPAKSLPIASGIEETAAAVADLLAGAGNARS